MFKNSTDDNLRSCEPFQDIFSPKIKFLRFQKCFFLPKQKSDNILTGDVQSCICNAL